MKAPLVSVVMSTYQGDNIVYLMDALDSVLNQTYSSFEIILVVDGAVDCSRNAFFLNFSFHNRVRIYRNKCNRGPSFSRNIGISKAEGQYIAIMDADDLSCPNRLADQLEYIIRHDLDVISSWLTVIDENGSPMGIRKVPLKHSDVTRLAPFICPLHNASAFGKSAVFKRFKYDNNLRVSEDYDLWVRLLIDGFKLGNTSTLCVKYRQGSSAIAKRVGLKYAVSDFRVRCRASSLCHLCLRPIIFIFALLASFSRLMPAKFFELFYRHRMKRWRI